MNIIGEKGLVDTVENGLSVFGLIFELLPEDFRTVIIAAVALSILLGIFAILSR